MRAMRMLCMNAFNQVRQFKVCVNTKISRHGPKDKACKKRVIKGLLRCMPANTLQQSGMLQLVDDVKMTL